MVKEHYLRDDIYGGSPVAAPEHRGAVEAQRAAQTRQTCLMTPVAAGPDLEACKLSATPDAYLVIDTNVALHQARGQRRRRSAIGLATAATADAPRGPASSWISWSTRA